MEKILSLFVIDTNKTETVVFRCRDMVVIIVA